MGGDGEAPEAPAGAEAGEAPAALASATVGQEPAAAGGAVVAGAGPADAEEQREDEAAEPDAKRQRTAEGDTAEPSAAQASTGAGGPKRVKRKMALVFGFIGQRFRGLQINYEIEEESKKKSVEEVLRQALVRASAVTEVNAERLEQKIGWARSSRTDQGVSAARIVVSAKFLIVEDDLSETGHCASLVSEVNRELPEDIRCFSAAKVPNSFDAKRACSWREYEYLMPADMARKLDGSEEAVSSDELASRIEKVMRKFEGCHSFHNFTRLKASDLLWKEEKEGKAGATGKGGKGGKGKGKKGKGKGKGKAKGKKRPLEEEAEEADVDAEECEDGGPGDMEAEEATAEASAAAEAAAPAADGGAGPTGVGGAGATPRQPWVEPPWVEICARDAESGAWRERKEEVIRHTQSTVFMCAVEPTRGGALLRVRLRGKFFLYNQIRLMVGTAAAVVSGAMSEEFLDMALQLHIEMHMPLAPPTGLMLRTAGFCEMDQRTGFCAMDDEQATSCMMPAGGFVLIPEGDSTSSARAFGEEIEANVERQWREGNELREWLAKLKEVRAPSGATLEELRAKVAVCEKEQAEFRQSQAAADRRRRDDRLAAGSSFVGVMPRRFAADMMVRFRLVPGWRVTNMQHALSTRLRRWESHPDERPEGLSSPPETRELLDYVAKVGVDVLSEEGARS